LLLGLLPLPATAYGAGELDPPFGSGGKVLTDFGGYDGATDVAIQPGGKMVTCGFSYRSANDSDFALARYNRDGSLDPSFDGDGRVVADCGGADVAIAANMEADDKIVAAGDSTAGGGVNFALARYNRDGSLDPSFGSDGKVLTDFGGADLGRDVAIQADGK